MFQSQMTSEFPEKMGRYRYYKGRPGISGLPKFRGEQVPWGVGVILISLPTPIPCSPVEISYKSQLVGNRWPWLTNKPPQAAPPVLGLE